MFILDLHWCYFDSLQSYLTRKALLIEKQFTCIAVLGMKPQAPCPGKFVTRTTVGLQVPPWCIEDWVSPVSVHEYAGDECNTPSKVSGEGSTLPNACFHGTQPGAALPGEFLWNPLWNLPDDCEVCKAWFVLLTDDFRCWYLKRCSGGQLQKE